MEILSSILSFTPTIIVLVTMVGLATVIFSVHVEPWGSVVVLKGSFYPGLVLFLVGLIAMISILVAGWLL